MSRIGIHTRAKWFQREPGVMYVVRIRIRKYQENIARKMSMPRK